MLFYRDQDTKSGPQDCKVFFTTDSTSNEQYPLGLHLDTSGDAKEHDISASSSPELMSESPTMDDISVPAFRARPDSQERVGQVH
jgi:hypothetical protein